MPRNVLVAQSGNSSPVVNNSLRGVILGCRAYPSIFGTIYGGRHGMEGILREELINISAQPESEIDLLATTPSAGVIGMSRYNMGESRGKDLARVVEVFQAHDIGFFFHIGDGETMATTNKVSAAAEKELDLIVTGIPTTIANDLGDKEFKLMDHTPGYGSAARYWAYCVQDANEENAGSCPFVPVLILQTPDRDAGFISAAARLADPERRMPLQIYMPESGLTLEELADNVNEELGRSGRCMAVLSEGFDPGNVGARRAAFGRDESDAWAMTSQQAVVSYLNERGLAARGAAGGLTQGTDRRNAMVYASVTDMDEAYWIALHAVEIAVNDGNGWMATVLRKNGEDYQAYYDKVPLEKIADSRRTFPSEWLSGNGMDVTDGFVRYARPLMGEEWPVIPIEGGLQQFARFRPIFADKKCGEYVPEE